MNTQTHDIAPTVDAAHAGYLRAVRAELAGGRRLDEILDDLDALVSTVERGIAPTAEAERGPTAPGASTPGAQPVEVRALCAELGEAARAEYGADAAATLAARLGADPAALDDALSAQPRHRPADPLVEDIAHACGVSVEEIIERAAARVAAS